MPRRRCRMASCLVQQPATGHVMMSNRQLSLWTTHTNEVRRDGERCQLPICTFLRSMTADNSPRPLAQSDCLPWWWAVRWRPRRKTRRGQGRWRPGRVARCSRPRWSPCPPAPAWFWLDLPHQETTLREWLIFHFRQRGHLFAGVARLSVYWLFCKRKAIRGIGRSNTPTEPSHPHQDKSHKQAVLTNASAFVIYVSFSALNITNIVPIMWGESIIEVRVLPYIKHNYFLASNVK